MTLLLVLNRKPYDGTDVAWNALRLARTWQATSRPVRIFLMNDAVDLARTGAAPEGAEFDLPGMLQEVARGGAEIKLCTTCVSRCGISKTALADPAWMGGMSDLARWIAGSDKVLTF